MQRSKEELKEDREALHRLMRAEQRCRNELRTKAAHYGFSADPAIALELEEIDRRLRADEEEFTLLETLAAESGQPLAEVQYRIAVAEAWNTPQGCPSVVGAARLELERLRLGVAPDRAQAIEDEVRAALVCEAMHDLKLAAIAQLGNALSGK